MVAIALLPPAPRPHPWGWFFPVNVLTGLDNQSGDGQDELAQWPPWVWGAPGGGDVGVKWPRSSQGECSSKGSLVGGQEVQWQQSTLCFAPAAVVNPEEREGYICKGLYQQTITVVLFGWLVIGKVFFGSLALSGDREYLSLLFIKRSVTLRPLNIQLLSRKVDLAFLRGLM